MHSKTIARVKYSRRFTPFNVVAIILLSLTSRPLLASDERSVLIGTVTNVVDGDTIDVSLESGSIRVRLNAIDAPEKRQPGGREATTYLSARVLNKAVDIEPISQDRYGRMVAIIFVDGQDINRQLVEQGFAWASRRYMKKSDASLCTLEYQARTLRRGLWRQQSPSPIAPWEFRHADTRDAVNRYENEREIDCISKIGKTR